MQGSQLHIADQSDKAPATKGIEAWKCYQYNHYQGYTHVPNIVLSVNSLSASPLMTTTFSDGASQLLSVPPAKRFNESISQNRREESLSQIISGIYEHSNVIDDAIQDENRNPHVRDPGAQTLGIQKVVPCPGDIPEAPHHATYSIASLSASSPSYIWNLRLLSVTLTTCSRTRRQKYIGCCPLARGGTGYHRHRRDRRVLVRSSGSQDSSVPVANPHSTSPRSPILGAERMRREKVKARHGRLRKGYGYHRCR